jgi:hypothetical protein
MADTSNLKPPESLNMQANKTVTLSKRGFAVFLIALLALSALNIYLVVDKLTGGSSPVAYDFVVSQNGKSYQIKNTLTGSTSNVGSASDAINSALKKGDSVYLNSGTYTLTGDIIVENKTNAKIEGDAATINGDGYKIIIRGDNYSLSQYNTVSDLTIINGTLRIEDSFGTTIQNMVFENTATGIELANTQSWSENTQITNCHFINATEGIAFRTPVGNLTGSATGSYDSSQIDRCFFNLQDNSVAVKVEALAEFSDSQMQDDRIWAGQAGHGNQTGLLLDGSMYNSLLFGVVFESFTDYPNSMYAVDIGKDANTVPIMDGGVSFLGNWTANVHNPYGVWLSNVGTAFSRQNIPVAVGLNSQWGANTTIQTQPLTIYSFTPQIQVGGTFAAGEVVTVRVRLMYVDNVVSTSITKTFNSTGAQWLTDNDMLQLYPSQDIVWGVVFDAQSNQPSTSTSVMISGYGTAG